MERLTYNGQLCVIAALPSFENNYYFCTLVARRKLCESRYHAKLQKRCSLKFHNTIYYVVL